jgi:hypothetical protein
MPSVIDGLVAGVDDGIVIDAVDLGFDELFDSR